MMLAWLRSIADAILGKTGKPDRADTATRMARDADFCVRGEGAPRRRAPPADVDPLEELQRIVGNRDR
jgi:hypothetical protein